MGYDRKYGKVTTEHGGIPDDEPVIVFRARDAILPGLLEDYLRKCEQAGSPARHLDLIRGTQDQVLAWQEKNPEKVRTPDSERSRAWMSE